MLFSISVRAVEKELGHDFPSSPSEYVTFKDGNVRHTHTMTDVMAFYGLGEKTGKLDKRGRRLRCWAFDAMGYDAERSDPLYKHAPLVIVFDRVTRKCRAFYYLQTSHESVFDFGCEKDAFRGAYWYWEGRAVPHKRVRYWEVSGGSFADTVRELRRIIGPPAVLPRYAFGYLGSTMAYTEAPDAATALASFAKLCKEHDIPCSLFHLSSGYTTDEKGRRQVFTWSAKKFPTTESIQSMVKEFSDAGIRLAANVKPHLLASHPLYKQCVREGILVEEEGQFWSGGPGESEQGRYINFLSPEGVEFWKEKVTSELLDHGIAAVWNDNNEFSALKDAPEHTLQMAKASHAALVAHRPLERPFVLTRAGPVEVSCFAQTWSGDNYSSWHSLRFNIPMGLGMSLSGYSSIGHDVGGFAGPTPGSELLTRWVEQGIFQPRFCMHSWKKDGSVTTPWLHAEALPRIRELIRLRYALVPYLYSLTLLCPADPMLMPVWFEDGPPAPPTSSSSVAAVAAASPSTPSPSLPSPSRSAPSPLKPSPSPSPSSSAPLGDRHRVGREAAGDEGLVADDDDFRFLAGPSILVTPVLAPGATTVMVALPERGAPWLPLVMASHVEAQSTAPLPHGAHLVACPLGSVVAHVRAGAILPLDDGSGNSMGPAPSQGRTIRYVLANPRAGADASGQWVEDDGITSVDVPAYSRTVVTAKASWNGSAHVLSVVAIGDHPLPYTEVVWVLPRDCHIATPSTSSPSVAAHPHEHPLLAKGGYAYRTTVVKTIHCD